MPQQEYFGIGTASKLGEVLQREKPAKIFLVIDKDSYEASGAKSAIQNATRHYDLVQFDDFQLNPKLEDAVKGAELFGREGCDFLIAVGGGSAIDIVKLVRVFAAHEGNPQDYVEKRGQIQNKGRPLVAIPTTAGTGSESTQFAVVYIGKTKHSLDNPLVLPDYAIVDPNFTLSLPKYQTASTGMDALSQAIESYWCIHSTDESKDYARRAIALASNNLANAVNRPTLETRMSMSEAAHLAGKAINISRTTAPHAVSYPITSYFNVPHGHAVALTLAPMLVYNSNVAEQDVLDKRGVEYVRRTIQEIADLLGAANPREASKRIDNLMKEIGLSRKLSEVGAKTDEDIKLIIRNGFNPDRVKNNPRLLTEQALREILHGILK